MRIEGFRLKHPDEIEKMRASGRILGACLAHLAAQVRPGIRAVDLDREAETFIRDHHCVPGFIGYNGFPNSLCVSVNEQVVHGIPGERVIEDGDLVSLDCGLTLEGWWADSGLSLSAGSPSTEVSRLLEVTEEALRRGIEAARPGGFVGDIGHAVQSFVESCGFSVVRQYVGHGIGRDMHEFAPGPQLRQAGHGQPDQARAGHRHRAHGQRRQAGDQDPRRRLDRGHRRRPALLLLRAHGGDHRDRPRDPHPPAPGGPGGGMTHDAAATFAREGSLVYSAAVAARQPDSARPMTRADEPLVGRVIEPLPDALYRVELADGHKVLCHPAGKARLQAVRILPGDRVQVELSTADPGRGRIVQRLA